MLGLSLCSLAGEMPSLPELPKLVVAGFLPEVRSQVQQAYDSPRAHPKDAQASGALGMVLDL
jgi:hypothetical protein